METLSEADLERVVLDEIEARTGSRIGFRVERVKEPPEGESNWKLVGSTADGFRHIADPKTFLPFVDSLHKRYRLEPE